MPKKNEEAEEVRSTVRVEFLDSIAGLKDVDTAFLDRKYAQFAEDMASKKKRPKDQQIYEQIAAMKKIDRYSERRLGFTRDWSFKPGDKRVIGSEIARLWEDSGIVVIIPEERAAA